MPRKPDSSAKKTAKKAARKPTPKKTAPRELMTQAAYARHRGVSGERVRQWRVKGQLVTVGEGRELRVDVDASDRRLAATRDPQQDFARPVSPEAAANYDDARARRELANAELAELKLGEERERLVDRTSIVSAIYDLASRHKTALLNLPARTASTMAAQFGADEHEMREALEGLVRAHLAEQRAMTLRLKMKSASGGEADDDDAS